MDNDDESETCWICLEEAEGPEVRPGPLHGNRLIKPCRCPRVVHSVCLAKWQLSQSGKSEEEFCRFCKERLPDWQENLALPGMAAVEPVMSVHFNGQTHMVKVKPGEDGRLAFIQDVRRLLRLRDNQEFSITFECKVPGHGMFLDLKGLTSYDAAVFCAAMTAVERQRLAAQKTQKTPCIFDGLSVSSALGRSGPPAPAPQAHRGAASTAAAAATAQSASTSGRATARTSPGAGAPVGVSQGAAARPSDSGVARTTVTQQGQLQPQQLQQGHVGAAAGIGRGGSRGSNDSNSAICNGNDDSNSNACNDSSSGSGASNSSTRPSTSSSSANGSSCSSTRTTVPCTMVGATATQSHGSAVAPLAGAAASLATAGRPADPSASALSIQPGPVHGAHCSRADVSSAQPVLKPNSALRHLTRFFQQQHGEEDRVVRSGCGGVRPTHWDSSCEVEPSGHDGAAGGGGAGADGTGTAELRRRSSSPAAADGGGGGGGTVAAAADRRKDARHTHRDVASRSGPLRQAPTAAAHEGRALNDQQQQQHYNYQRNHNDHRDQHPHHHAPWLSRLMLCVGFGVVQGTSH